MRTSSIFLTIVPLMTISCGSAPDPATEEPITLQAGRYEITYSNAVVPESVMRNGPGGDPKSVCIGSADFENDMKPLSRKLMAIDDHCEGRKFERTGNHIAGQLACPLDPQRAGGKVAIDFSGRISQDMVEVKSNLKADLESSHLPEEEKQKLRMAFAAMGAVDLNVTARRVGEC